MKRSPMKKRRPKVDLLEKKIRASAKDEECTLLISPVCSDRDTVVYCHSNKLADGKGMGLKAKIGAYGCFACHNIIDGRAPAPAGMSQGEIDAYFERGAEQTRQLLIKKGIIHGDQED